MKNEKLSFSGLKEFSKSLQHYLDYKARKKEQTDPMRFGSLLHLAVLEPEKFESEVNILSEEINKKTNKGKELAKQLENTLYATPKEINQIITMHKSIFTHPVAGSLLTKAKDREIWLNGQLKCSHGMIDIHGKADAISVGNKAVCIDLKTISDADISDIEKAIHKYNYHWQSYFYREMLFQTYKKETRMLFIFVDKTDKHNVQVVELDDYWNEVAKEEIEPLLNDFYKYLAEGEEKLFRGYSNTIQKIACPGWLKNRSKNSRFATQAIELEKPLIEFKIGANNDNNKTKTTEPDKVVGVPEKAKEEPKELPEKHEPTETNAEIVETICESPKELPKPEPASKDLPGDDNEFLLKSCEKIDGYVSAQKALEAMCIKAGITKNAVGINVAEIDFKDKQKISEEISKMLKFQQEQAQKKAEAKNKKIEPKQASILDVPEELDF